MAPANLRQIVNEGYIRIGFYRALTSSDRELEDLEIFEKTGWVKLYEPHTDRVVATYKMEER